MNEQNIKEHAIETVGQQIMESGCTSGRQQIIVDNKEYEVAWELTINVL